MQQSPAHNQPRVIRVFVSSTFKDMQAERDELVKFIFPQLRKLCDQRGVTWGQVDLRWGITEEQKSEGKVLPICLDEIQRCRPYFIGVLGERYGWVPDEISTELVAREPWLKEHLEHSVTELEILHGVLNAPQMAEHASFYFRDPGYVETLPIEQRADFFESESSPGKQKLEVLKKRIRKSGLPVHENYQNPKEFGQIVLQDLTAIIDKLFPEGSQPDPLDREAAGHEIFALSRAQVYIGRQPSFDRLDAHARSKAEPLVILGESGSGKSALLANWAIKYRKEHPDELVLMHFIGATPGSADWAAMLLRILGEFKRRYNLREEIPNQAEALRNTFTNWLNMAAARGRVVLVLDALNQLEDKDGAPDLVWLPPHIPENVRVCLSTLPGRPLDELKKRGWPVLTVEPLQVEERKQLIEEYLALFTKTLAKDQAERIAAAAQCQNPLFLRVLLDELRLFGSHEQIGERIESYLKAPAIPALYQLILERCEQDYERERPGLVRDSMSLLWAARRGLSETELLELLGTDGQSLPRAYWSPLYLAMEQSFLSRGGLIGFFHEYLRQAVQNRYLSEQSLQRQAHLRLADTFAAQSGSYLRRLDELPWQLAQAREWQRLFALLGDLEFFKEAWEIYYYEILAYWVQVEANSPYRSLDAYQAVINQPAQHQEHAWYISVLLGDTGYIKEALALRRYLVELYRNTGNQAMLGRALNLLGMAYTNLNDSHQALEFYEQARLTAREIGDRDGEGNALANLGGANYKLGETRKAIEFYEQALVVFREIGDRGGEGAALGNLGQAYDGMGETRKAIEFSEQHLKAARENGDRYGEGNALRDLGVAYSDQGDARKAMAFSEMHLEIAREIGNRGSEVSALGHLGNAYAALGDARRAAGYQEQALRLAREIGDRGGEGDALGSLGNISATLGEARKAIELYEQALVIQRELGDRRSEGSALANLGSAYNMLGEVFKAIELFNRALVIHREIGDRQGEGIALANLGNSYSMIRFMARKAIKLFNQALIIQREIGDRSSEGKSLISLGNVYTRLRKTRKAIELFEQALIIHRQIGERQGEGVALGNLGNSQYQQGEKEKGIGSMQQALAVFQAIESPQAEWVRNKLQEWGVGD